MLQHEQLSQLSREFQDHPILSVYVDADQRDPAKRAVWRTKLDNALSKVAQQVESEGGDVGGLKAAVKLLDESLGPSDGYLQGTGWVAFIGPTTVHEAGPVPFRVPTQVFWSQGPHIAPYFRGLRHHRPVTVVVADRRRARLLRHQHGSLEEQEGLQAFTDVGDVTDSGVAKRAATSSGVRGATGKDLAQRFLEVEANRLHQEIVKRIQDEARGGGPIVIGGPSESASRIHGMLDRRLQERAVVVSSLAMDASTAELRPDVTQAVRELAQEMQKALLKSVSETAHKGGNARLGVRDSRKAIRESRADTLLLSERMLEDEAELADQLVEAALAQGARVEVLVGDAGGELDGEGEGAAVRLRF